METIEDPVFGKLEFNDTWIGEVDVPFLGRTFELHINNSRTFPPDQEQRAFWQRFMARQGQLRASVERALFDYYNAHLEELRMPYSLEEEAKFAPSLERPSDIWALLEPLRSVWIDWGRDDTPSIGIEFSPTWDEEHGLGITFYKDQIGIAEGGANWLDQDHYDLNGQRIAGNTPEEGS